MPRTPRFPPYPRRPHRGGQARITVTAGKERQDVYLGDFGSPDSYRRYEVEMARWRARLSVAGSEGTAPRPGPCGTVGEMLALYHAHLRRTQVLEDGSEKPEIDTIRRALRPVELLFGDLPPGQFGPRALKEVRRAILKGHSDPLAPVPADAPPGTVGRRKPYCRKSANGQVNRIRAAFRWAEEEELIEAGTWAKLHALRSLEPGQDGAFDHDDVLPPPLPHVTAALAKAGPVLRGMCLVSMLSGARPSELFRLRPCDVVRSGPLVLAPGVELTCGEKTWAVRLRKHKTARKGVVRVLLFGPRAQEALRPFLDGREPDARVFRPVDAVAMMRARRAAARKTRPTPSELRRAEYRRTRTPRVTPRDHYDRRSYRQAVHRACRAAGVPEWNPYQLRHLAASVLASEFGVEVARIVLGHRCLKTTMMYVLEDLLKAAEALSKAG